MQTLRSEHNGAFVCTVTVFTLRHTHTHTHTHTTVMSESKPRGYFAECRAGEAARTGSSEPVRKAARVLLKCAPASTLYKDQTERQAAGQTMRSSRLTQALRFCFDTLK